jgi:SAM-dependent methyltransferase
MLTFRCNCCKSNRCRLFPESITKPMSVVMCRDCGLVATYPGLNEDSINKYYKSEFDGDPGAKSPSVHVEQNALKSALAEINRHTIPIIEKWIDPKGKDWLEIRFRTGAFLKYLSDKGANVFGADLFQKNIDRASSFVDPSHLFSTTVHTLCEEIEHEFDVISGVSIHVLSHLPDPTRALATFKKMLKPNGLLIFEEKDITKIPNYAKTLPLVHPNPVAHYHHFTFETCQNLLIQNGYQILLAEFIDRSSDLRHFLIIAKEGEAKALRQLSSNDDFEHKFDELVKLHTAKS